MDDFFELWESWSNSQKIEFLGILFDKKDKPKLSVLWEQKLNDYDKKNLWEILPDNRRANLLELLSIQEVANLVKLLSIPEAANLLELLPDLKNVANLLELLLDLKKVASLLEQLTDLDKVVNIFKSLPKQKIIDILKLINEQRKIDIWKLLPVSEKADILEFLSRTYSLAHVVFSIKEYIENDERFKKRGFKNLYVSLEASDNSLEPEENGACVFTRIEEYGSNNKTLYIKILYETKCGIVEYDRDSYISEQCARFLIGHEISHLILNLGEVIEASDKGVSKKIPKNAEVHADFLAKIISDLRDLHILKLHTDIDTNLFPSREEIAYSYNEKIQEAQKAKGNISPSHIIESALKLYEKSKNFTMSNSIFALKEIMNIIYGERSVSLIYPEKGTQNSISKIGYFQPEGRSNGSCGYSIIMPKQESEQTNVDKDSHCIAEAIGAFLLCYDEIKEIKKSSKKLHGEILVNKDIFPMEKLQEFSKCLSTARRNNLNEFSKNIKSKNRILNLKKYPKNTK